MRSTDQQIAWHEDPWHLGLQARKAATVARDTGVTTWITDENDVPVAAIVPVADAERARHAGEVMIQARRREEPLPVAVRAEPRHRRARSRRLGWPFRDGF